MILEVKVDPKDARALNKGMKKLAKRSAVKAVKLVHRTALVVETVAKRKAPYDTGTLSRSIRQIPYKPMEVLVATNVEYAPYQELGTRYMRGKHFMRRGYTKGVEYMAKELLR